MNAIALALVLFAAVLHASWNFVSKKSGGGSSFVLLYETFAFLIYMPLLYLADLTEKLFAPEFVGFLPHAAERCHPSFRLTWIKEIY